MKPKSAVNNNNPPDATLHLEWIHGYRGFDCRNNLFYLTDNCSHLLFHTAAMLVAQYNDSKNQNQSSQAFFGDHTDDIISLAIHRSEGSTDVLVASGEIGKSSIIIVSKWKLNSDNITSYFESIATMKGFHQKGVCQLAFSSDGTKVFSIGMEYSIAIYRIDGRMIASSQGPKDKILHCCYLNENDFLSCGEKHIILWKYDNSSKNYKQMKGKLGTNAKNLMLSVVSIGNDTCVVGTSEGDLLTMQPKSNDLVIVSSQIGYHEKAINAIWSNNNGSTIISAGKDQKLIIWNVDANTKQLSKTNIIISDPSITSPIRSIFQSIQNSKFLIGTQNCEIIELISETKDYTKITSKLLLASHFKDELWGLDVRSGTTQYCTVGDDSYLRIWDLLQHKQIFSIDMKGPARCCAFSPDGVFLAVGFGTGEDASKTTNSKKNNNKTKQTSSESLVRIYRVDTLLSGNPNNAILAEIKEAKRWISVIKFSSDGLTLFVGSKDNSVYLYSVVQQFRRKAKFSKHNAGILNLDVSLCGKYMQSCCG